MLTAWRHSLPGSVQYTLAPQNVHGPLDTGALGPSESPLRMLKHWDDTGAVAKASKNVAPMMADRVAARLRMTRS